IWTPHKKQIIYILQHILRVFTTEEVCIVGSFRARLSLPGENMTKKRFATYNLLAASTLGLGTASADTYLQENFDNQTIPLGPPTIGHKLDTAGSTGSPFSLSTNPALGTKSLTLIREGGDSHTLNAFTTDGLMKDGVTVDFDW